MSRSLGRVAWWVRGMCVGCVVGLMGCAADDAATPVGVAIDEPVSGPSDVVVVPMSERGGHLFVPAEVNGRSAGVWLLDTGAGVDAIGMGLSGRLNLPREG
ncbi:MAG: hypothetical protein AAF078_10315, partial [Planctomycetota bacterium]